MTEKESMRKTPARLLATFALGALAFVLCYYLIIIIKGYAQTPELIEAHLANADMALNAKQLSEEQLRALLAVEDPNFFSHHGVDLSTPGAGLTTITQSLAKRLYFEQFQPGLAKIKQSLLAFVLDQRMEKWAQLDLFINTVYLGNVGEQAIEGFATGARAYCNKEFDALTREEYLALVAMIIAPNDLSIASHPEQNAKRVQRIERLLRGECKPSGVRDVYYENCGE